MPRYNWSPEHSHWSRGIGEHTRNTRGPGGACLSAIVATLPSLSSFIFHFLSSLSPWLSSAMPWAATKRELLQWSTKSSLFLPFLVLSFPLDLMHTGTIYRMQCHSRNSQIALCSEHGSYNINTLLINSKTMSGFYLPTHVTLYLMLISASAALWDALSAIWSILGNLQHSESIILSATLSDVVLNEL